MSCLDHRRVEIGGVGGFNRRWSLGVFILAL